MFGGWRRPGSMSDRRAYGCTRPNEWMSAAVGRPGHRVGRPADGKTSRAGQVRRMEVGMEFPEREVALAWVGRTLVDRDGAEIGSCTAVFADDATRVTEWVCSEVNGAAVLMPAVGAVESGGQVQVAVSRDDVANAPTVGGTEHISDDEEAALYRHYGIPRPRRACCRPESHSRPRRRSCPTPPPRRTPLRRRRSFRSQRSGRPHRQPPIRTGGRPHQSRRPHPPSLTCSPCRMPATVRPLRRLPVAGGCCQ
jgi:hypothetical protein